ncbi:MAG TPA: hypothetical protein VFE72_08755, partial [Lysobacter sp.]|nr:hypothetical protein [Lysobacter sp.]
MAMTIGRLARGAAWTTAGLTGLVAALLLVLLAINWQDRPPSADALRLARLVDERAPVADADNAYVYLLGMSVPRAEDPARWGARRRAWLDGLTPATPRPLVLPGVDAP